MNKKQKLSPADHNKAYEKQNLPRPILKKQNKTQNKTINYIKTKTQQSTNILKYKQSNPLINLHKNTPYSTLHDEPTHSNQTNIQN